jgi:hypothetical protein
LQETQTLLISIGLPTFLRKLISTVGQILVGQAMAFLNQGNLDKKPSINNQI